MGVLDAQRRLIHALANDYEWDAIHDEEHRIVVQKRHMKLAFDGDTGEVFGYDTEGEDFAFRESYAHNSQLIRRMMQYPAEFFEPQA